MPEERVSEEMAKFAGEVRTSAERHVKLAFILDRIAEQETVSVSQGELVERLWRLSQRWKKDPAQVRAIFDKEQLWPSVVSSIRQEKTMRLLMDAAAIDNGTAIRSTEQVESQKEKGKR